MRTKSPTWKLQKKGFSNEMEAETAAQTINDNIQEYLLSNGDFLRVPWRDGRHTLWHL